jgi:hypothetical protein
VNIDIEDQLRAGMQDRVTGLRLTTDILGEATRRHQRRTAVQRSAYAAGVVGLAGALAAIVALDNGAAGVGEQAGSQPPVASAASPQLQLAAAIAASENISYQLKITGGSKADPRGWTSAVGAYDPSTSTGYLTSSQLDGPGCYYQRLIKGVLYLGNNATTTWKQEPGNGNFEYGDVLQGAAAASADPQQLFKALRQAGAKVTQTGAGRYHFESTTPFDDEWSSGTDLLVGNVTLDANKRIAKVTTEATKKGQFKPGKKGGTAFNGTAVVTVELSDYGTPVKVEKPTKVIVAK